MSKLCLPNQRVFFNFDNKLNFVVENLFSSARSRKQQGKELLRLERCGDQPTSNLFRLPRSLSCLSGMHSTNLRQAFQAMYAPIYPDKGGIEQTCISHDDGIRQTTVPRGSCVCTAFCYTFWLLCTTPSCAREHLTFFHVPNFICQEDSGLEGKLL